LIAMTAYIQAFSQQTTHNETAKADLLHNVNYSIEAQLSLSNNKTPLWLNANRHGLSSLKSSNGYVRGAIERPISTDSLRRWGIGYGVDLAVPSGYTSSFVVQQAYVEGRWLHGTLSIGSKERPMELKNNALSSGSQTLGINARPIPQVRIALPEYWVPPFGNGWIRFKGHIAYGIMTDDGWQHEFTRRQSKYADNVLFHSKAGFIKIGNEERFLPWSVEFGLEMAATFGGTAYRQQGDGTMLAIKNSSDLSSFFHALIPSGSDAGETTYKNVNGNHVGSWLFRLNYDGDTWGFSAYADKYFEDHSAMFQLDYDGYGSGENWNKKEKRKFLLYDLKDIMLGLELRFKQSYWLDNIVAEYIYTKYQSGPVYHDHTANISDHIGGIDGYYEHGIYTGWQHWGQVIGNPLYRSPLYNDDSMIDVKNSRFMAFHLGVNGRPTDHLGYRVLATWQEGLGTYSKPYTHKRHNVSFLTEATWNIRRGWSVRGAYGMDFGSILGHNAGFQLTIIKSGKL